MKRPRVWRNAVRPKMNETATANIHATCVAIGTSGVLLLGKSGAGKSDLALRLIMNKNAVLIADDRVDLSAGQEGLTAAVPENLAGLLEVRGVGIVSVPYRNTVNLKLAVQLETELKKIERLPEEEYYTFGEKSVPLLKLYPFENSAPDKIVIKLKAVLDKF